MFLHNLKYELMVSLRVKDLIIWMMIFPVVLGSLFKIAFGNIYTNDTLFNSIPTAVVENEKNDIFHSIVDDIEKSDAPLLKVTYMSEADAMKALENDEVKGIIYVDTDTKKEESDKSFSFFGKMIDAVGVPSMDTKLSLKIKTNGIEQTILKKFTENYMAQESIVRDAIEKNPMDISSVTDVLTQDMTTRTDRPMTEGNTDPFTSYMYNLIAMIAMFGSVTGLHIAAQNQANLSNLGARRNCSPTPKSITLAAGLVGSYIAHGACIIIGISYEALVLGVDFGSRLPLVYLGGIVGGLMGVSMGFCVGSISTWSQSTKVGIVMSVSMLCCFLSGLMMGDIKGIIELNVPLLNDLNPAAIVCDALYYLNVDADLSRFFIKLLTMAGLAFAFAAGGFVLTRRRKYASL